MDSECTKQFYKNDTQTQQMIIKVDPKNQTALISVPRTATRRTIDLIVNYNMFVPGDWSYLPSDLSRAAQCERTSQAKIDLHMMDRVQRRAKYSCKTALFSIGSSQTLKCKIFGKQLHTEPRPVTEEQRHVSRQPNGPINLLR